MYPHVALKHATYPASANSEKQTKNFIFYSLLEFSRRTDDN
jgi:hypothetical protein